MSFPTWNSDPSFNKITSTYFKDLIDLSGNFIIRNGTIKSPANTIEFDDTFSFINFLNSVNIYGQQKLTYNSIEYDVGLQCEKVDTLVTDVATLSPIVSDTQFKLTGLYWDSGISTTVFVNNVSFPSSSISSSSINNTSFVDLLNTQTIAGVKTFNSAPVMSGASISVGTIPINRVSGTAVNTNGAQNIVATKTFTVVQNFSSNIRLDGSLLLSLGTITLSNADLQKIAFLNTASSNIQTQINNITSSSILASANNTYTGTNTYSNTVEINNTLTISVQSGMAKFQTYASGRSWSSGGVSDFVFEYSSNYVDRGITIQAGRDNTGNAIFGMYFLTDVLTNATARVPIMYSTNTASQNTNVLTISSGTLATTNIRLDGTLSLNSNALTLTNANLQKIQYLSTLSSDVQTQINTLTTNSVSLSASNVFTGATNQFSNTLRLDGSLSLNANALTLTNANLQKIQYLSTVSSDVQTQITGVGTRATTLETKTTKMSYMSVGGINTTTILDGLISQTLSFTNTINNISTTTFSYINSLTSNAQAQLTNLATKLTAISYEGSNTTTTISGDLLFNGTLNSISTTTFGYLSGLTSAIQTQLNSLSTRIAVFELVGTIIMSPLSDLHTTSGNKYLHCTGQLVSRTTYSALFTKIGTTFGSGDGSTTFAVPNYQGLFFRGMGGQVVNSTTYTGVAINSVQQDSIQTHQHGGGSSVFLITSTSASGLGGYINTNGLQRPDSASPQATGEQISGRSNATETRPVNVGIYYYIKT
jgi:microcystin-dependent protein